MSKEEGAVTLLHGDEEVVVGDGFVREVEGGWRGTFLIEQEEGEMIRSERVLQANSIKLGERRGRVDVVQYQMEPPGESEVPVWRISFVGKGALE